MRQQYHSRTVDEKRYVWDVNKLVELAKKLPIIDLPLANITELDEAYWHEEGGWKKPIARDIALHAKLIYDCSLEHPIILGADGNIMDGMHRVCRALIEDHKTIKAVKFIQDPDPDYIDPNWDDLPYNDNFQETLKRFGLPHKS